MRSNRSVPSQRSQRRGRARRWKRSKLSLALICGPVILAVVAGSVFAAGSHHPQGHREASAQPARAGEPDPDCTLAVPEEPLSARGLATPYELVATDPAKGPCHDASPDQAAFMEAPVRPLGGKTKAPTTLTLGHGPVSSRPLMAT